MWRFLINLEVVTYDRDLPSETYLKDLTSEALSRLHLSSKSLPGVLEDMEVPDEPGGGVR